MSFLGIEIPKHPNRFPGFSMGYRYDKELAVNTDIPGPGTYNLPSTIVSPRGGVKFSNSSRFKDDSKERLPGPGSYLLTDEDFRPRSKSPVSVFLESSSTLSLKKNKLPKVGTFSKSKRPEIFPRLNTDAGPGAYDVTKAFESLSMRSPTGKISSLGPSPRQPLNSVRVSNTPGPGAYQTQSDVFYTKTQKGSSFGTSTRDFLGISKASKEGVLGDTYYKYNKKLELDKKKGPRPFKSKTKRLEMPKVMTSPGPGQYDVREKIIQKKELYSNKGTFGVSSKFYYPDLREKSYEPGPGEYTISDSPIKKGISFTKGSFDMSSTFLNPGPGYYEVVDTFTEKMNEIHKKIEQRKKLQLSKTRYETSKTEMSPVNSIELRSKTETDEGGSLLVLKRITSGEFSPIKKKDAARLKQGIQYRESIFEEMIEQSISPGPKYLIKLKSIQESLGEVGTRFTAAKKTGFVEEEIKKDVPGPGTYKLNKQKTQLPVSFAGSKRKENVLVSDNAKHIPGVGKYELKEKEEAVGGMFSKAGRGLEKEKETKKKPTKSELDDFFFI